MKRLLISLLLIILLSSCVSRQDEAQLDDINQIQHELSLINLSAFDDNVYVGISNPYKTKEKMLENAIIDAATNILISEFLVLNKILASEQKSNFGYNKYNTKELFVYQDEHLPKVIKSLEILKVYFSKEAGCIVIAKDTRVSGNKRVYSSTFDENGVPTWVNNRPQINGYIVGVGSTLGYRFLKDSLLAADHEAIYDISSQYGNIESYVQNYFLLKQTDLTTFSKQTQFHNELATVKEVKNIDYWYDKSNNMFYSLVVMKDDRKID